MPTEEVLLAGNCDVLKVGSPLFKIFKINYHKRMNCKFCKHLLIVNGRVASNNRIIFKASSCFKFKAGYCPIVTITSPFSNLN